MMVHDLLYQGIRFFSYLAGHVAEQAATRVRACRVATFGVCATAVIILTATVQAETSSPPVYTDAQEFAPILWLATDERLYPILPHAFAFDGIDNNENGLVDLQDPDEVRMGELDVRQSSALVERLQEFRFLVPFDLPDVEVTEVVREKTEMTDNKAGWQYQPARIQQLQVRKEVLQDGFIPNELRRAFAIAQIELSPVVTLSGTGPDTWKVTEYRHCADLKADKLRPLLAKGGAPPELLDALSKAHCRLDEAGLIYDHDMWRLDGKDSNDVEIRLYLCDEGKTLVVYGNETREYDARLIKDKKYLEITRASRMPPPRVCYARNLDAKRGLTIWEYWLYYLFDIGTGPHKHDSELVVVFADSLHQVVSVVGTGHSAASANNILVRSSNTSLTVQRPQSLPKHMPILVELGKHASAPDRGFNGQFDVGMDANAFYADVWGSRDILAAFGKINLKRMNTAYSFPRDFTTLITEKKWFETTVEARAAKNSLPENIYTETFTAADEINLLRTLTGTRSKFGESGLHYELFPVAYMAELEDLLNCARNTDDDRIEIANWLEERVDVFWVENKRPEKVDISPEAFEQMLLWAQDRDNKQDMWRHPSFGNPENVFKLWLFPRMAISITGWSQAGNFVGRAGLQFADVSLPGFKLFWFVQIPKIELYKEATIEFYADIDNDGQLGDIGYVYNKFRGSHGGWYYGLARSGGLHERPNPVLTFGVVPISWDTKAALKSPFHAQLSIRAGIRAELDTRDKPWNLNPIQLQIGIQLALPVWNPRHPLDY